MYAHVQWRENVIISNRMFALFFSRHFYYYVLCGNVRTGTPLFVPRGTCTGFAKYMYAVVT